MSRRIVPVVAGLLLLIAPVVASAASPGTKGSAPRPVDSALRAVDGEARAVDPSDAIVGVWATAGGINQAQVRIERKDDHYFGTIVGLTEPLFATTDGPARAGEPKSDFQNPDPALHGRPIIGIDLLQGFRYQGKRRWGGGTIYDPESGKTYKCKLKLTDDHTLDVRGYIGIEALGRTTVWTRTTQTGETP